MKIRLSCSSETGFHVVRQVTHAVHHYFSCHFCHRLEPVRLSVSPGAVFSTLCPPQKLTFRKPRYVSFATNILSGLHGMYLLVVVLWFIYQLKHESVWVMWIRKVLQWIEDLRVWKWIGKTRKWIKDLLVSSLMWIRHPQREYRENKLYLHRNIFWYFTLLELTPRRLC